MAGKQAKPEQRADPTADVFHIRTPVATLPRGGGAIRGIGEKFAANPVTGTASLSVPIFTSPGRSGFGPQLSLSYDSGAGNGPFGFGWNLSIPSISRKTDKGLPKYKDSDESDVFILSGSEDLVPVLVRQGEEWVPEELPERVVNNNTYRISRYRPREGLFAKIERWTNKSDPEDTIWRSISKDNITTWYGKTQNARIADPADKSRVFSWLISESCDDKGNVIAYEYKEEDSDSVDVTQANERNRTTATRSANRYLKHIRYGNHEPYFPRLSEYPEWPAFPAEDEWLFEVVFDYGEHEWETPKPKDIGDWPCRNDPFSSYRAGFEVRTYRLCQRVLMFHHFPDEPEVGTDSLVRSTDFTYSYEENPADARNPIYSVLLSVTQSGYRRQGDRYLNQLLPPLEFEYSQVPTAEELAEQQVYEVDPESLENLPVGLDGGSYQWVDLDGEGIAGILTEQGDGWYYKRNLSPDHRVPEDGTERAAVWFGLLEQVAPKPATTLGPGQAQFLDLAADGHVDLVQMQGPVRGFYERTYEANWEPFRPFSSCPNVDASDPNLRFADLTGDGHADIVVTEEDVFTWYPSLAEAGFGPAQRVHQARDEEKGPRLVFADSTQSIYLADLSGDGLTDLVRIRNGEVCYWPNLGYGRFGAKVMMDNAPWFDSPDEFDQRRIRLADTDGSGTTDIIYLGRTGAQIFFNQSGNRWSTAARLPQFPPIDNLAAATAVDLLGNGTACLVWSSPLPEAASRPMRYIDLMGRQKPELREKPHLLIATKNNLGAETRVRYSPSTRFYLQDKREGRPWITRLPFPVHCVERVEIYDRISRNRFVTRYAYHHGYFDGEEREFHGFGMVEQWDTEEFAALAEGGALPETTNLNVASHVPPVLTRTWFHTGVYVSRDHVSDFFAGLLDADDKGEYYREPGLSDEDARALLLSDTVLPPGLTSEEERQACRVLKGSMLRQEVYALDGTGNPEYPYGHPYTVIEQNFAIQVLQRQGPNRHAVFFAHPHEAIEFYYERELRDVRISEIESASVADPRVSHTMTLEVDEFGSVLKAAAIGYGRREKILIQDERGGIEEIANPGLNQLDPQDRARQTTTLITYTENSVTNAIDTAGDYRTPLPAETGTYELTGYTPTGSAGWFQASDFVRPDPNDPDGQKQVHTFDSEINYQEKPSSGRQRRPIERVRTLYRPDDVGIPESDPLALLPLGVVQPLALLGESYKLAFTPGLLAQVFHRNGQPLLPNPASVRGGQGAEGGGYVDLDGDGHWWIPTGRVFLSPDPNDSAAHELAHARQHFFLPYRYRDPFHTSEVSTESFVTYDTYDLLTLETRDALGNRLTVGERLPNGDIDSARPGNDYRVLQPRRVMDPNRNRSAVAFDALGMVVGTAVMGKPEETLGDSLDGFDADLTEAVILDHLQNPLADRNTILGRASTRLVYDLFAYQRTQDKPDPQPAVAYTLARETHDADLEPGQQTRVQHSFSCSDGFGREIQKKIQAEPGPVPRRDANGKIIVGADGRPEMAANDVSPRWVGSGWTVFNNKGKPVRQYEPFFTDTHRFEFDVRIGVSPILFYDPVGRVVATLHPNHTWEKVVFDPWRQETWDVSDTALATDPSSDPDAGEFFRRRPEGDYLPTWHARRIDGALGPQEQDAARKAAVHVDTPTTSRFDSLGRVFLTIAHNKFKRSNTPPADPPIEEFHCTRVVFDIEGNQREVIDAKDRVVMRYDYDMLGQRIHQASMEAGERWMLNDVAGKPIHAWDSRGHAFRTEYDALRRPVRAFAQGTDEAAPDREILFEQTEYGEGQTNDIELNLRTRVFRQFDGAGIATNEQYDFKGNLLSSSRQLAVGYKTAPDWLGGPPLETEVFESRTTYDALNRPLTLITPDNSVVRPTYNEANLLERLEVNLRGAETATTFVTDIDYNAKGQRELIAYGNTVTTFYEYDPLTFRLTRLRALRGAEHLQDLSYTYDPAGNITHIRDDAQQTIYFNNAVVEPCADYTYDSLYRLIAATGREHIGQASRPWSDEFRVNLPHPNDGQAMRRYSEQYEYDEVGNFLQLIHRANTTGQWTRRYEYNEPSLIEPGEKNNRLSRTTVDGLTESYTYDAHGNMTSMPHLAHLDWDFEDQLQQVDLGGGGTAFYTYNAAGQRVRKVLEGQTGWRQEERIYLGGFEVYRKYNGNGENLTLERETLHILDDRQRLALVETKTVADRTPILNLQPLFRYQLSNHLGSATLELDASAQVISYEEYYPYGSTSYQAVRADIEVSTKRYRYTGMERDEETGLNYHTARYYAPYLGRWLSCDPVLENVALSLYAYVANRPTLLVDPNGAQFGRWIRTLAAALGIALGSESAAPAVNEIRQQSAEHETPGAHEPGPGVQPSSDPTIRSLDPQGGNPGHRQHEPPPHIEPPGPEPPTPPPRPPGRWQNMVGRGQHGMAVPRGRPSTTGPSSGTTIAGPEHLPAMASGVEPLRGGSGRGRPAGRWQNMTGRGQYGSTVPQTGGTGGVRPSTRWQNMTGRGQYGSTVPGGRASASVPPAQPAVSPALIEARPTPSTVTLQPESSGAGLGLAMQAAVFFYFAHQARTARTERERQHAQTAIVLSMVPEAMLAPVLMDVLERHAGPVVDPIARYWAERAVESGAEAPPRNPAAQGAWTLGRLGLPTTWALGLY